MSQSSTATRDDETEPLDRTSVATTEPLEPAAVTSSEVGMMLPPNKSYTDEVIEYLHFIL
jgi:hypothetical protein